MQGVSQGWQRALPRNSKRWPKNGQNENFSEWVGIMSSNFHQRLNISTTFCGHTI